MGRIFYAILATALLVGCGRTQEPAGLDRDRFVEVVAELRRAGMETRGNQPAYEARKAAILESARVTEEQLRAYVDRHGSNVEHMAEVWNAVNSRLSEREAPVH